MLHSQQAPPAVLWLVEQSDFVGFTVDFDLLGIGSYPEVG